MTRLKFLIAALLCLMLFSPALCFAHRLNVFAWLENNNIMVSCNFGKQRPAMNAKVTVMDAETKKILNHGQTNAEGSYMFPSPLKSGQKNGLIIEVDAGQGHVGKWEMDASELAAAASLEAGFRTAKMESMQSVQDQSQPDAAILDDPAITTSVSPEQLSSIITQAVAPLQKEIASIANKGPGFTEILGGIGWIIGLIGIGMYFKAHK